jgi:hypothetical protein
MQSNRRSQIPVQFVVSPLKPSKAKTPDVPAHPVELDVESLKQVAGGVSPKGTWSSGVLSPKGTW